MEESTDNSGLFGRIKNSFGHDDVHPRFGIDGDKEKSTDGSKAENSVRSEANNAAADSLKNVESAAGAETAQDEGAKQAEERAGGFYSGSGKSPVSKLGGRGKGKGVFKKVGPLFGIFFSVFCVGGLMGMTQLFQPFSLVAQMMETYNSMHVSTSLRTERFFYMQMNSGRTTNPLKPTIFGGEKFAITKKQATKLEEQGIKYDDSYEFEGKKYRVLRYENGAGQERIVTADSELAKKMRAQKIPAIDFKVAFANDNRFFQKYSAGSMTWRGQIAGWFGDVTNKYFKNNGLSRNVFKNYKEEVAKADGDAKKATQDIISKRTGEIEDVGIRRVTSAEKDGDQYNVGTEEERGRGKTNRANINVSEKLDGIRTKIQGSANIACAVFDTAAAISLLVAAAEANQIVNLALAYFESVDKVKAGYGDESPIHVLTDALNEEVENTNVVLVPTAAGAGQPISGESGTVDITTEEVTTKKSAIESEGLSVLFSGGKANPNDPSVQSFNLESSMNRILGGIGTSVTAQMGCTATKAAAAMISFGIDAVAVAGCIATWWAGGGACWALVAKAAAGVLGGMAVAAVVGAVITAITPWAANALTRDLVSYLGGEDYGNGLASAGNMILGNVHRANGGSMATREEYIDFAVAAGQVTEENARYERETLSPFDMTSKYTFIGSILTNMTSFLSSNSLMSTITAGNTAVSSSISALTPTTTAVNLLGDLYTDEEYTTICPYLYSIGAVGDVYCNPYMITDVSTIDEDPQDVIDRLDQKGCFEDGLTSDENVIIKGDSECARYYILVNQRTSPPGVVDINVKNELDNWTVKTGNSLADSVINGGVGSTPFIGDTFEVLSSVDTMNNMGYIADEVGVAGNTSNYANSPNWDEAKDYQRFYEDQAWAESAGLVEKSAVAVLLDDYYEKNPLDNSYEGVLARYSGLEKDTVADILDVVDYYDYVAHYDPSDRYAFGGDKIELEDEPLFDDENKLSSDGVLLENIVYADVRNRSFAV